MNEIPEGFEPYTDEDGDEMWLDEDGIRQYVGPSGPKEPGPGWKRFYIGPPLPKPRSLEDKVRDLAVQFEEGAAKAVAPSIRGIWRDVADELRGLLES